MVRDSALLDYLAGLRSQTFSGDVYRATRQSLDPLTPSTSGGRWMAAGGASVLYASFEQEGALAEVSFHWGQWTPRPSKPASLHTLRVSSNRTLRLLQVDMRALGLSDDQYGTVNPPRTQEIGDAVQFLECDGLMAPSARWCCENLMLFPDNFGASATLEVVTSESVDWLAWGIANGLVKE